MLRIGVMVSGGGTNLQANIDGISKGTITNTEIAIVVSNNKKAYALERAKQAGIEAVCISPKDYENREQFNQALTDFLDSRRLDLIVLAGCLVVLPETLIKKYTNKIINIHPSLIPAFCGKGYYGLKVHEEVLKRGDAGTDTGPIIFQKPVEILENDTPEILQRRVMEQAEWIILPKAIDDIANGRIEVVNGYVKNKVPVAP